MRVLVVVAGVTLGLSGCITGGIVHRAPSGNETAGEQDASALEQAPWQLNATTGSKDGAGTAPSKGGDGTGPGKGSSKGPGGTGGTGGTGGPGNGTDDGTHDDQGNETDEGPGALDPITDQAPTEGAAGADDIFSGVEDGADDMETPTPKDPLGGAGDAAGDISPDDVNVGVPVSAPVKGPGVPKSIPNADPTMLA